MSDVMKKTSINLGRVGPLRWARSTAPLSHEARAWIEQHASQIEGAAYLKRSSKGTVVVVANAADPDHAPHVANWHRVGDAAIAYMAAGPADLPPRSDHIRVSVMPGGGPLVVGYVDVIGCAARLAAEES